MLGGVATNAIADELIHVIEGSRIYVPFLNVLNKIDAFTIVFKSARARRWRARAPLASRCKDAVQGYIHTKCSATSAKYQPMRVGRDCVLADEDVIQIVKKCA